MTSRSSAVVTADSPRPVPTPAPLAALARRLLLRRLAALREGELVLIENGCHHRFGTRSAEFPVSVEIEVHDPRFYTTVALDSDIGAGESYMAGDWTVSDLTLLTRLLLRNRAVLDRLDGGTARLLAPLRRLLHWLNRNSRDGSRRNIAAHYDLGNDFFALWLDETLMYSSAVFERADMTLAEASVAKLERICRRLDLKPGDRVLEIGTGWGGFALHAAGRHGCHVTTVTLSRQQYDLARSRVRAAGLERRVEVRLQDYRDVTGSFDKLVSIEMIEAVGHRYFDTYFRQCSRLLKPDGRMLLQAITIADQRYEQALRSVDFIQRHIFPGGCLPSVTAICNAMTRATDLRVEHLEDIGVDYARTLREWRHNFHARLDQVRSLGYPESFIRMWEFYLCYCEGGFEERAIGTVQMLLTKPRARPVREPGLLAKR
ncbi:MAG: class I SAM-dependent methyltransferase [Gammaproteobacteria bacterium]